MQRMRRQRLSPVRQGKSVPGSRGTADAPSETAAEGPLIFVCGGISGCQCKFEPMIIEVVISANDNSVTIEHDALRGDLRA